MIHELSKTNSIANLYMSELRHHEIQQDRLRFRENLRKISQILAYELSKSLDFEKKHIETPLGSLDMRIPILDVVVVPILRSGVAMHEGLLDFFPNAESSFMSTTRIIHKDGTMDIQLDYVSSPDVQGKTVILADPLIATGSTIYKAVRTIREYGEPVAFHVVSIISCISGIEYLSRMLPRLNIWTGAIDEELTAKSLIVPGLGDVDELSFGKAIDLDL